MPADSPSREVDSKRDDVHDRRDGDLCSSAEAFMTFVIPRGAPATNNGC